MPVQKPRGRKRVSHRNAYAAIVVLVVLVGSVSAYAYLASYFGSGTTTGCPTPPSSANGDVYVCINTSQGEFEVALFAGSAPKTVANFVNLTKSGFFTDLVWHRIATNPAVIQTGDPLTKNAGGNRGTWGTGGSTQTVPLEVSNSSLHNYRGYLGMARGSDPNSGTSQFYINTQDNTGLDGSYTVFGRVVSGMNVVDAIAALPISSQYSEQPATPSNAMLLSITILSGA
jgi:cyclophilin family peptidyl-prolyl cis-trans isomerase